MAAVLIAAINSILYSILFITLGSILHSDHSKMRDVSIAAMVFGCTSIISICNELQKMEITNTSLTNIIAFLNGVILLPCGVVAYSKQDDAEVANNIAITFIVFGVMAFLLVLGLFFAMVYESKKAAEAVENLEAEFQEKRKKMDAQKPKTMQSSIFWGQLPSPVTTV